MRISTAVTAAFCGLAFSLCFQQKKGEPFRPGQIRVKVVGPRYDPEPRWVSVAWKDEADRPFAALRREVTQAMADPSYVDISGVWAGKAKAAYEAWTEDSQNPLALARASAYLGVARNVDPKLSSSKEMIKIRGRLNEGWAILRDVPLSYEFARFGYLFNAGDPDYHKYKDLAKRLWDKRPNDRAVACATVGEYRGKKPNAAFEKMMFDHLEAASKLTNWRATDDWVYALAFRLYGQAHKDLKSYPKAVNRARIALARLPKGFDQSAIKKWIEETEKEAKDPNFGRSPGAQWIDDIYP